MALRQDPVNFTLLALTVVFIPNITQNIGMVMNESSAISSLLQSSGTLFTVLLAMLLLREKLGVSQYLGIMLGLLGSILLATNGLHELSGGTFVGNMLVLLSAVSYSISSIVSKKTLARHSPSITVVWVTILGSIMLLPCGLFEHQGTISGKGWLLVLGLAIMPNFIALILWYAVLEHTLVSRMAVAIYLIPVIALVLSYFLLGEMLTIPLLVYAGMIVAGVIAANIKLPRNNGLVW